MSYTVTVDPSGARSTVAQFEEIGEAADFYTTWCLKLHGQWGGSAFLIEDDPDDPYFGTVLQSVGFSR